MEMVILCGVQGSGKTTLYRDRFAATHEHVSLDVVGTRAREAKLLAACLEEGRSFVVDNTNPTVADRARYIDAARAAGFKVIGYLVEGDGESLHVGPGKTAATRRRFVRPTPEEGFDELWHASGRWRIEPLVTTPPLF
jgi:type II secretory pathway predicted ATPase ExeA